MRSDGSRYPLIRHGLVLILLALPLLVTASAIEAADWVTGLPSLKALVLASLIPWALLAQSRVPWWIGHTVVLLLGLVVAFLLGTFTLAGNSGPSDLGSQLSSWFGAIGGGEGHLGTAMTGVGLIAITLWMTHTSVWLAYRHSLAPLAALPGLGVLLVVLTFLPEDFYWYFFVYLLASAPGIAYRYKRQWALQGWRASLLGTLAAGVLLMSASVGAAWKSPTPEGIVIPLGSKFEGPWYSFREHWTILFSAVPNRKEWPSFSAPRELSYDGPIQLGDEVLFVVKSRQPYHWRVQVYETYTGSSWESETAPVTRGLAEVPLEQQVEGLKARKEVEIGVRMYSRGSGLVSVGEPLGADILSKVELSPEAAFRLYLQDPQQSHLPPELMEYREGLVSLLSSGREARAAEDEGATPRDNSPSSGTPGNLRSLGFRPTSPVAVAGEAGQGSPGLGAPYITVKRIDSAPGPPLALVGEHKLLPYRQYATVGSVSQSIPAALRNVGQDYPDWVADRYLQLPPQFPASVRALAEEMTKDEDNPYDKTLAIQDYLRSLTYTLDVELPPEGKDWVEFFLEQRRGFCQNYASAMITMLRSLDIPARLVIGFAPGVWDEGRGVWEVQARHYHAWPEVYFPDYGWVEFEPTPADVQEALEPLGVRREGRFEGLLDEAELLCLDEFADLIPECQELLGLSGGGFEAESDGLGELATAPIGDEGSGGGPGFPSSPWTFLGIGLSLALLAPVGAVSYARWSVSRLGYVTVSYAVMCFLGRLAGVAVHAQDTPWAYSRRLSGALPGHAEEVARVTHAFVTRRYGPPGRLTHPDIDHVRRSWPALRKALFRRILRRLIPGRS